MGTTRQRDIDAGEGWLVEIDAGRILRLEGTGAIELYAYNRADHGEWIDAARTRVYNLNIFPTTGHRLFSKQNNPLMRFARDGLAGRGRHDLQAPTARPHAVLRVLAPLGIAADDLPDPVSLCRPVAIDPASGRIDLSVPPPDGPVSLAFEAEIDVVCAIMAETGPVSAAVVEG